jgi:hypothetical protein
MKMSNKLLLGLLIVTIITITVNILLVKKAIVKEINKNTEQRIERVE